MGNMVELDQFLQNLGNSSVYYPILSSVTGGVTASILLCQLLRWQSALGDSSQWVSVTVAQIEAETGLTREEQLNARRLLTTRELLQERWIDSETREFWVNIHRLSTRIQSLSQSHISASNSISWLPKTVEGVDNSPPTSQAVKSDPYFPPSRQQIAVSVTPHYLFSGPWQSQEQFEAFQQALLDYAKEQGFSNPSGWMFKIIDAMTKGIISPFWDEFITGKALGETQQVTKEWEVKPGIPYPAFEEERIQYYVHKGEPLEAAVARARADLRNPVFAKDLWEGFLRKCDRMADEALKAKQMGIESPHLPPSFTQKREITKESVIQKLEAIASPESLPPQKPKERQQKAIDNAPDIPSLEALQKAYQSPLGRSLIEKQIADHPEWGYKIENGEIIDLYPF